MRRIIFIDDDAAELAAFCKLAEGKYDCTTVHWPSEVAKLLSAQPPDIIVSDLYLPSTSGDTIPTAEERRAAAQSAKQVGERFSSLFADAQNDDKARLQQTTAAISAAYGMLELQWKALGQSPDHGVALLARLNSLYPGVPVVFYSRKITTEDVIRVLRAGAVDAIRKGALKDEEVLARFAGAETKVRVQKPATRELKETAARESPTSTEAEAGISAKPSKLLGGGDGLSRWIGVATKAVALGTAVITFMLARGKFLEWFHASRASGPATANPNSGPSVLVLVVSLYVVVYLLFVTGGVLERVLAVIVKAVLALLHLIPSAKENLSRDMVEVLEKSIPKMFDLTWDVCVIVLAVIPAVRYIFRVVAHP